MQGICEREGRMGDKKGGILKGRQQGICEREDWMGDKKGGYVRERAG